jgi:hypothetical protein
MQFLTDVTVLALSIHALLLAVAAYFYRRGSRRERLVWKLFSLDAIGFGIALPTILLILGEPQGPLALLSILVYVAIATFACLIEVPGYLILSGYDEREIGRLTQIRKALVKTSYSFDALGELKVKVEANDKTLQDLEINDLLTGFIETCERLKNLDRNYWALTLAEITSKIDQIGKTSKHPTPKLVELVSLVGLSFLIAQFLKLLG